MATGDDRASLSSINSRQTAGQCSADTEAQWRCANTRGGVRVGNRVAGIGLEDVALGLRSAVKKRD
jgi:hypothetical protein